MRVAVSVRPLSDRVAWSGGDPPMSLDERLRQVQISGLTRVAVYGPESTGKSTLAAQLAAHFAVPRVDEYARHYIQDKLRHTGENCVLDDILAIAIGQQSLENHVATQAGGGLIVCDTDLLTIKAYSDLFFGSAPPALNAALPFIRQDLYLLTDIDIPWVADGIRDRPQDRPGMLAYFEQLLERDDRHYVRISGDRARRLREAIAAVEAVLPRAATGEQGP